MSLEKELQTGMLASGVYEQLKDRFEFIRQNIIGKWESTGAADADKREILYHKLHALNELERSFVNDINTGKLAQKQLETENVKSARTN